MISIDTTVLHQILRYEPETGMLFWLPRTNDLFPSERICKVWNTQNAGKQAFVTEMPNGYLQGAIFGRRYLAHRVIWAFVNGKWPEHEVDHINGIRHDNRIGNLRAVTRKENGKNLCRRTSNTSGVTGVCFDNARGKWGARIKVNYKYHFLGRFDSFEEAVAARKAAEVRYGFHSNHDREKVAA